MSSVVILLFHLKLNHSGQLTMRARASGKRRRGAPQSLSNDGGA